MSLSHRLQLFTNCPSVDPFHGVQSFRNRLLQRGSPQGHKPCQQTCSGMGSSLHRSAGPARSLLQNGLPTESQLPSGIHLLQHRVPSTGYRLISAPPWTFMGCRGTACVTMVFIMICKGKLSAPASQAPHPTLASLTLVSAELFLSHSLTPLSRLSFPCSFFLPLLKYFITEVLPPIGWALTSGGSILEPAGIGSIRNWGSL